MADRPFPERGFGFGEDEEESHREGREILRQAEEDTRRNKEALARNPQELSPMMKKFMRHANARARGEAR